MKAVSQRQYRLLHLDVKTALRDYAQARAEHFANPDRHPIRIEMRVSGLIRHRELLRQHRAVLAAVEPVKYITYSEAAAASERRRHAAR